MDLPVVDAVLLSWNRSKLTVESIESLQQQEGIIVKIWVVDQGSRPEELKILRDAAKDFENVYIHELSQNVGVPAGRNIGTRLGTAPYIVSIDNDAVFESNFALSLVIKKFKGDPKLGVVSFRIKNFFTSEDDELSWVFPKSMKSMRSQSFLVARFVGCGHAIRREAFERAKGYDDDLFFYWEETDFSYKVINLGYTLYYEPEICVLHKVSPEGRVKWEGKRFYYLVRNAIYINIKYKSHLTKIMMLCIGYMAKGIYNGLPGQAFSGILDGIRMGLKVPSTSTEAFLSLNDAAKQYLWDHETKYRGSFINRLKTEVFVSLPGRN